MPAAFEARSVHRVRRGEPGGVEEDFLAAEEPLEVRLNGGPVVVTMRTPGEDEELALGFLFSEGVVREAKDVLSVSRVPNPLDVERGSIVNVRVTPERILAVPALRATRMTSACGVCSLTTLEDVARHSSPSPVSSGARVPAERLASLPARMRGAQAVFDRTGGLHAAALFDAEGALLALREDVGRHNTVDKVVGWALSGSRLPLSGAILVVSGRAGYEILQKAVAAGVPLVAAVGAPSGLAARYADRAGVTLAGFLRDDSFNVYSHPERILP